LRPVHSITWQRPQRALLRNPGKIRGILEPYDQLPVALPPIREDLRLYPGPPQADGTPTWRILDPIRNSFFEIGWLEFELLARWREHGDAESLMARVAAETPLRPALEEVQELISFLAHNQLLASLANAVGVPMTGWGDARFPGVLDMS